MLNELSKADLEAIPRHGVSEEKKEGLVIREVAGPYYQLLAYAKIVITLIRTYVEAAAASLTISADFELSKAKTDTASPLFRLLLHTELLTVLFSCSSKTQFITLVVSIYLPFILSE